LQVATELIPGIKTRSSCSRPGSDGSVLHLAQPCAHDLPVGEVNPPIGQTGIWHEASHTQITRRAKVGPGAIENGDLALGGRLSGNSLLSSLA
jgi:hypothetical protein